MRSWTDQSWKPANKLLNYHTVETIEHQAVNESTDKNIGKVATDSQQEVETSDKATAQHCRHESKRYLIKNRRWSRE